MEQSDADPMLSSMHKITADEYRVGSRVLRRTSAGRNEPEAVLEGVAMAGFVGLLRQLGDLAQLAAEVFHGLHDEVTAASARARELTLRAWQLEAELPLIEKHFCQELFLQRIAYNAGRVDWHADLKVDSGVVKGGRMPRFIVECVERCRGPPELSMLDKYDVGGEGACLKRYTNASFFRTDSACCTKLQEGAQRAKSSSERMEIKPEFQSSESYESPISDTGASDGLLAMVRQLKYRQANRSVLRSIKPQTPNFHNEDSSEEKGSVTHGSKVNTASNCLSESSTQMTDVAVGAASVSEEKTCDLGRTSSFGAWLPPGTRAPESERTEQTSQGTSNERSGCLVSSNGTPVDANKSKENDSTARNAHTLVKFITSRVSSLPKKVSVKKHDPLAESFRNMAKKLFEIRYDAIRGSGSDDFEPNRDREEHEANFLDMSQCKLVGEAKEERRLMERVCSDLAQHSYDPCERQLAQASVRNALDHESTDKPVHTMEASHNEATENFRNGPSEDVPDLSDVSLDDKSTKQPQKQLTSNKSDDACEPCSPASIDEDADDSITKYEPGTVPRETDLPMLVSNPMLRRVVSLPDDELCNFDKLHQPITRQEQNGCSRDTKDAAILPLPPISPMQWLSIKVHTGSGIASPALRSLGPKSLAPTKRYPTQPTRKQNTEVIQAGTQHNNWTSQTEMAQTSVSSENADAAVYYVDGASSSFRDKEPKRIDHKTSFRKNHCVTSDGRGSAFSSAVEQNWPEYSLPEVGSHERIAPSFSKPC